MGDGVVVTELRAGDRDQPVGDDGPGVGAGLAEPARSDDASTSAPPASRAVTAAVGDQPAVISDFASGPDIPKAKADPPARSSPSRNWLTGGDGFFSSVMDIGHPLGSWVK